jgi:transposase
MDTVHNASTEPVRRVEVFTGSGRRRRWSAEDKARIVAETETSGDSVCAVARRYGLSPQQVFGWRRQLRDAVGGGSAELQFVPAVIDVDAPSGRRRSAGSRAALGIGTIAIEVDGVTIRAGHDADVRLIAALVHALKGGR